MSERSYVEQMLSVKTAMLESAEQDVLDLLTTQAALVYALRALYDVAEPSDLFARQQAMVMARAALALATTQPTASASALSTTTEQHSAVSASSKDS